MTTLRLLDNIVWHSLSGPHASFAVGSERVRRYAEGYSQLIGAAEPAAPDFDALAAFCRPGEQFYVAGWTGSTPASWRLDVDAVMEQYVWDAPPPAEPDLPLDRLGTAHVAEAMALVALTHPGPFGTRTLELGEFYGVIEEGRLVAMAGERMHAGDLREVSAVCTHPAFQGRGLARRLMEKVVRGQLARGQTPFLHVMTGNVTARSLYERMGFRHHQRLPVRTITYVGAAGATR